jgi:bifunctional ADP-heptose synthase (sugar kinase/adenylyltransferase)
MMSALEFVDFVTFFEETDPIAFITTVKPDVHVNGADWGAECMEKGCVLENGGRLHIATFVEGLSTSEIIKKIKSI